MKKVIWQGKKLVSPQGKEVGITFNPETGFLERDGKLFVVVDIDPAEFSSGVLPTMLGVSVFDIADAPFLDSATDDEIFAREILFGIESYKPVRPGPNPITVESLEKGHEYCFVVYAEYPDQ